jgi:hypothetical protein
MVVWKLREGDTGYLAPDCVEQGIVTVGFSAALPWLEIPSGDPRASFQGRGQVERFRNEIEVGDLLFVPTTGGKEFYLAQITGQYQWSADALVENHHHFRTARWFGPFQVVIPSKVASSLYVRATLTRANPTAATWVEDLYSTRSDGKELRGRGDFAAKNFVCRGCFTSRSIALLADPERQLCTDCV